jgi:hypothetical protein
MAAVLCQCKDRLRSQPTEERKEEKGDLWNENRFRDRKTEVAQRLESWKFVAALEGGRWY